MVEQLRPQATAQGNLADFQRPVNSHVSEPGNDSPAHHISLQMTAAIEKMTHPHKTTTSSRNPPPSTNSCPCSLHTETGACIGNVCCVKLPDVGTLCYALINLIHKAHGSPHSIHVYCFFFLGLPPHSNGLLQISNRKGTHAGAAKK